MKEKSWKHGELSSLGMMVITVAVWSLKKAAKKESRVPGSLVGIPCFSWVLLNFCLQERNLRWSNSRHPVITSFGSAVETFTELRMIVAPLMRGKIPSMTSHPSQGTQALPRNILYSLCVASAFWSHCLATQTEEGFPCGTLVPRSCVFVSIFLYCVDPITVLKCP